MSSNAPFSSLVEARRYVRQQLEVGLPAGWAAQWKGSAADPLPAAGSWLIARYDPVLGIWQGSDQYTLLLTADLSTFALTHSNGQPGVVPREAIATTAALVPVAMLSVVPLGDFIGYALRTYQANVYDLT